MGNITEGTPISYCNGEQVQTNYTIKDSEIHFNVSDYNSTQQLIIDPVLVWATYYANAIVQSEADDIYTMQTDGSNVWLAGFTFSSSFPTYNPGGGAYFQGIAPGYGKIIILKFTVNGILRWATYYGGTVGYDWATSIYSDKHDVWVTGYASSANFPTLNPGGGAYYQGILAGGENAFILQFDTAGARKWATYYGGSKIDEGYSINSDGKNVWITGYTESPNFPTLNPGGGAYFQSALGGGSQNAFILQFNAAGVQKWGTYYGGNGNYDVGYSINSDGSNVWITGVTPSTNFPTYNPGGGTYFQGTIGGLQNAFILRFDTKGVRKWATYYGGNDSTYGDIGYFINSDGKNVWLTGKTGSSNFPTLNPGNGAYFQGKLTADYQGNVFILQFDTMGIRKWATYYGGNANNNNTYGETGYTIQSDGKNVWVCGATVSKDFPTLSSGCGYNQDNIGGVQSQDVFILQFNTSGMRKWATYYGIGQENDGSCAWSDGTNLFVAGDAYDGNLSSKFPVVNPGGGAYCDSTNLFYQNELAFIGKFTIENGFSVDSPVVTICRGDSASLYVSGAVSYKWSPSMGLSATNIPNPVASPTITTTYTITATDTGACAGTFIDSVKVIVDTMSFKALFLTHDTTVCKGSDATLNAKGGYNYNWSNGPTSSSISLTNISATQTYTVNIQNQVCKEDTNLKVTVTIIPLPKINLSGSTKICQGDSTHLNVSGGSSYKWSNGFTGSTYNGIIDSITRLTITAYNSFGCSHDTSITIPPDIPILSACCNTIIVAGNDTTLVAKGNTTKPYQWSPQVTCLNPPLCDSVKASPTVTTTYTVTLTDSAGCQAERVITIVVEIPCIDFIVPNVFTPDYTGPLGLNSVFYIKTSGLNSWSIVIYDRWGKEMYNSINPAQYWNGNTESGSKAPDGVYYYIINAVCRGTNYKKDGFVQLIR